MSTALNIESLHARITEHLGCHAISVKDGMFYVTFSAADKDFQVLPNFYMKEFLTRNTQDTTTILSLDVMLLAQRIRYAFGSPIGINSSYRNPEYNRSIGGAKDSQHIHGNALDTYPLNHNMKAYIKSIEEMNIPGGFGKYNTFCHVDVRKFKARWDERK